MKLKKSITCLLSAIFLFGGIFATDLNAQGESADVAVKLEIDKPGIKVSPDLFGIFFEEINLAGDGGIYPELIRNRSFEFNAEKPEFWTIVAENGGKGTMKLEPNDQKSEFDSTVLKVDYDYANEHDHDAKVEKLKSFHIANEGYWGIPMKNGETYDITIRAKGSDDFADRNGGLLFYLVPGENFKDYAEIPELSSDWKTYKLTIKATSTASNARFHIQPTIGKGTFYLDYVSLKPQSTYNGHGLRTDLMEKLAAMKPAFVRFPGGCWVEGDTMKEASRWKRTIGDPIERWTQPNLWGYQSTNGLGYHEYLQMCEDLKAEALFVINCGMSHKETVPMDEMDEYVQDALDAIEYANGPADSEWGKIRAKNGHKEPFKLAYIQIGNENGGPAYWERYDLFYTKIREKYPEIKIISNVWGGRATNKQPREIIDEHYYSNPAFFIKNANRYDSYDRNGPKIYVGEYAVTQGSGQGNLDAAIGEAAFMTGMERNSDIVVMSSYAPLFVNVNHRRWNPDLICFDNTRSYGIPSYHVQKLFGVHRSDRIVPCTIEMAVEPQKPSGAVGLGSWASRVEYKDAKIVKNGKTLYESDLSKAPENAAPGKGNWRFVEGVLRQNSTETDCRYIFGDENWSDYTFTVKARKIDGKEGFLILFNVKDGQWAWMNIGGWENTETGLETEAGGGAIGRKSDFTVESNRWYDIRVELSGNRAKCFIDDKMIIEQELPQRISSGVYGVGGLSEDGKELILKLVNAGTSPKEAKIELSGAVKLANEVCEIVLTSEKGSDENSLDFPDKVSPKESKFKIDSANFTRKLPPKSFVIMRVGVR